jgi:hypothetical protein
MKTIKALKFLEKMSLVSALVALGAAPLQAQYVPGPSSLDASKPWSLSVDARGFYDDNYLTLPKSYFSPTGFGYGHPLATWGTEVTPSAAVNHSVENTLITASYVFDARWNAQHSTQDETHQFDARIEHEFGEHYKLSASESFVIAQEPTVIDPGIVSTPFVILNNNVRNTGQVDFTGWLTKDFDWHLGYANTVYAYEQTADKTTGYGFNQVAGEGAGGYLPMASRSALSDRMEQLATLDLRWKATPDTTIFLGYRFGHTGYTAPEYIVFPTAPFGSYNGPAGSKGYLSNSRNANSDYGFAGVEETFTPDLKASLQAGAEYLDYYNVHTSRLSPYVDAKITWQYLPGDAAQLGVKHIHNATDVVGGFGTTPVLDEETAAVYLSEKHKIIRKLTATVTGQAQNSTYVGGGSGFNGKGEDFFVVQLNFAYQFNSWLLAETGYNYSRLTSDLPFREYTRNFGYAGLRTTWGP